ncbi:MAG: ABC transporter substrate-binding protein [Lachnospiraceae bacterium]|nr:ABC transporter substrate-binding protein [Lachnospiraceae bacterium]
MKRMKRIIAMVLVCVMAGVIVTGCGSDNKKEESGKIMIGTNRALGTVTPLLAEKLGYFEENGIKFEIVEFGDGTALMEAMAAGELDMGFVGIVPVSTWVAKGTDIRVVASANGGGHVIMSKESKEIKTLSDLKGHSLSTPSIGTVTDVILRASLLADEGIDPEEISIMPGMKPADMATALEVSGEVDAIMTWEPFASQAEQMYDDITVVADAAEVWKEKTGSDTAYPVNVVCATGKFADKHKEELKNVLNALEQTVNYINGDNHDDAVEKIAEILDVDKEIIENACKRTDFSYEIDKEAIYQILGWASDLGYLEKVPEDSELFYDADK